MLQFYYDSKYKYTNRKIIDISNDTNYKSKEYENIDSPDTINGHLIYTLAGGEKVPTYIYDTETTWRWFVTGITQLRTMKYQISLLRDIISESPETWKQEQAYIMAGKAEDFNKYKRWGLPYTNTKINQERLNFGGKSSFFVYYVNEQEIQNHSLTEKDLKITGVNIPGIGSTNYDYSVSNLNEIPYFEYIDAGDVNFWFNSQADLSIFASSSNSFLNSSIYNKYEFMYRNGLLFYGTYDGTDKNNSITIKTYWNDINNNVNNCKTNLTEAVKTFITNYQNSLGPTISQEEVNSLLEYSNKYIYNTSNQKVYSIKYTVNNTYYNEKLTRNQTSTLNSAIYNINFPKSLDVSAHKNFEINGSYFTFESIKKTYNFTLEEVGTATSFNFNFVSGVRKLPKSAVRCVNIVSSGSILDSDIAQALMQAQLNGTNGILSTDVSDSPNVGRILDIQYLPFHIAKETNENIKINDTPMVSQFLSNDDYTYYTNLADLTNINKETDTIKIVSPSRASQFLFRPYDNDGSMEFITNITLKPYASVIYVRPSTKGLLLNDWDDKDCLIINEDFSLTNVTNAWTQYIYNNKNYSNIFERELQGREFERTWERRIEGAQKKSDVWAAKNLSSEKAKALTGNMFFISNIAGALASTNIDQTYMQMAQIDRQYNEAVYQEGLSLSRDMFSYQMENIQAQPNIPSKITTIDAKFLDGIYLEYYSTNNTELNAIKNYYRYNGNRIDTYGSFNNYWGWFVKGQIIISNNYTQPEIDELNRRLSMGIFTEVNYD